MSHKLNALIFAVLCILVGTLTQASGFGHRPPHIHGPMFPPHVIGRPPHSHEEPPPIPAEAEDHLSHFHDEAPPINHLLADAESPLVPSDSVEPRALSDVEDRPPHSNDESLLGSFNAEGRPPHIHDHSPLGAFDAERRPLHIHRPIFPPHVIGRPPHSHEESPPIPAEAEGRPSHFHDEAPPMLPTDAELPLVPSDIVESRVLSDVEGRQPHIDDQSPLGPFNPEGKPPHIHDDPHVPYDKPFQHIIPDWDHIGSWVLWTPCDIDDGPRVRCQDCRTKLICTRLGGFVFENRDGSYCNDGLWSDVPSEECV